MQQQLGKTIRKYRNQHGYTINQLADKLGISIGLLSNIENGKTDSFQLTLLNNFVRELNIPICELKLFSEPYPIEELNIDTLKNFNKIKPSLDLIIDAFIKTASIISFDEVQIALITNMFIKELDSINELIESAKSK